MDSYPVKLRADGRLVSLVHPAENFSGPPRDRPWAFTLSVWRPGSEKVLWSRIGEDLRVSYGPPGYVLIDALRVTEPGPGCAWQREPTEILRIAADSVETLRLVGGTVAYGFPETGEPFIVWQTKGFPDCPLLSVEKQSASRDVVLALVDVDRIPGGHIGQMPEEAVLWKRSIAETPPGSVSWQGRRGDPAFVFLSETTLRYCDSTSCRPVEFATHDMVSYPLAPTIGVRSLKEVLHLVLPGRAALEVSPWGPYTGPSWAQGPTAGTISYVRDNRLHVQDLESGAQGPLRSLTGSLAYAWNRSGSELWTIDKNGLLLSVPIRKFEGDTLTDEPSLAAEGLETTFSPARDRMLTVRHDKRQELVEVRSTPVGAGSPRGGDWTFTLSGSEMTWGAFSVDGRHVILERALEWNGGRVARANVWILGVDLGIEEGQFEVSNLQLQTSEIWVDSDRLIGSVEGWSEGSNYFAVCERTSAGFARCSGRLERPARISPDGKYFVVDRVYSTEIYSTSDLAEGQYPLLTLRGTRSIDRLNRAIVEDLVTNSQAVFVQQNATGQTVLGQRGDRAFAATYANDGTLEIAVEGRPLRYPQEAVGSEEGLWGPEVHSVTFSSDGGRMIVDRGSASEVWDVKTGTTLALLPESIRGLSFFSQSSDVVQMLSGSESVHLLYLGGSGSRPPSWATEDALSAMVTGTSRKNWRGREHVLQAIKTDAEAGDPSARRIWSLMGEPEGE